MDNSNATYEGETGCKIIPTKHEESCATDECRKECFQDPESYMKCFEVRNYDLKPKALLFFATLISMEPI